MSEKFNIAIDGPAGSGKGTVSKFLSKKLNLKMLDTGATYRGTAYFLHRKGIKPENFNFEDLQGIELSFNEENELILNGENVEGKIRTPEISSLTAVFSKIVELRKVVLNIQKGIIKGGGFILEGRDATTVIAPDAKIKIYMDASLDERTKRRKSQLKEQGIEKDYNELREEIKERDEIDMDKGEFSLRIAEDAIYMDTTGQGIEEVANEIIKIKEEKLGI